MSEFEFTEDSEAAEFSSRPTGTEDVFLKDYDDNGIKFEMPSSPLLLDRMEECIDCETQSYEDGYSDVCEEHKIALLYANMIHKANVFGYF